MSWEIILKKEFIKTYLYHGVFDLIFEFMHIKMNDNILINDSLCEDCNCPWTEINLNNKQLVGEMDQVICLSCLSCVHVLFGHFINTADPPQYSWIPKTAMIWAQSTV